MDLYEANWTRALAVVAHPDDLEYGGASAIARWTDEGRQVVYWLACRGEAGIDGLAPEEAAPLREAEQRESARIVGVSDLEFGDFPDGTIEYGLPLRAAVAAAVRRHRPEAIITMNYQDRWPGGNGLNQPDHIAVGRAAIDGARDAGNRWVFRDQGLEPWGGVKEVLVLGSPDAGHGVDVGGGYLDKGIASLKAHKAYIDGLGGKFPEPEEFLESFARMVGTNLGCTFGVGFEVINL